MGVSGKDKERIGRQRIKRRGKDGDKGWERKLQIQSTTRNTHVLLNIPSVAFLPTYAQKVQDKFILRLQLSSIIVIE